MNNSDTNKMGYRVPIVNIYSNINTLFIIKKIKTEHI